MPTVKFANVIAYMPSNFTLAFQLPPARGGHFSQIKVLVIINIEQSRSSQAHLNEINVQRIMLDSLEANVHPHILLKTPRRTNQFSMPFLRVEVWSSIMCIELIKRGRSRRKGPGHDRVRTTGSHVARVHIRRKADGRKGPQRDSPVGDFRTASIHLRHDPTHAHPLSI
jgi:hypothetical protein